MTREFTEIQHTQKNKIEGNENKKTEPDRKQGKINKK